MNPPSGQHGAFVPADDMLRSINSLTVAVAENNVQVNALLKELKEVKVDIEAQRRDLDAVKLKLYTMSGVVGLVVSFVTNWVMGRMP